jgi:hypothetical protein
MLAVGLACEIGGFALTMYAVARWLRRTEEACGIRLRFRVNHLIPFPLYCVRRSGISADATAATLNALVPANPLPLARVAAIHVLVLLPLVLAQIAGVILGGWLRLQWVPG